MPHPRRRSIRAHILIIVLVGAIIPLSLIGVWLTASAVRSGKDLLREQLDASADAIVKSVQGKWSFRQGELLLLADNVAARRAVAPAPPAMSGADSAYLAGLYNRLSRTVLSFSLRDVSGTERWTTADLPVEGGRAAAAGRQVAQQQGITLRFPTHDAHGGVIGQLEARVALDAFISTDSGRMSVPGAMLGVRDGATRALLTSGPSAALQRGGEFRIGESTWMAVSRAIQTPPLELRVGAPIAAYVGPFERAGRVGLAAVAVVALLAIALSAFLTARLTRSIQRLVDAASAVARGELDRHVDALGGGPSEIGALAGAFNTMTDSLRRTLDELSRRTALSAVGEFAASLAHEVRNALTSVKVDLQRAEEKLPPSPSRELVSRTISSLTRLNSTVTGALQVARSGRVDPARLDLGPVLASAAGVAGPTFASGDASLDLGDVSTEPLWVSGDASALEQMFINLLINAGQSLPAGGHARVATSADNGHVVVSIADTGRGMDAHQLEHAVEPFYTTRSDGTGLGLPIAKQIATAHGGAIAIESQLGRGTLVSVLLPRCSKDDRMV